MSVSSVRACDVCRQPVPDRQRFEWIGFVARINGERYEVQVKEETCSQACLLKSMQRAAQKVEP